MKHYLIIVFLFSTTISFAQIVALPFLQNATTTHNQGFGGIGVVANEFSFQSGLSQNPAHLSGEATWLNAHTNYTRLSSSNNNIFILDAGAAYIIDENHAAGFSYKRLNIGNGLYDDALGFSYAYTINSDFSIGTSVKMLQSKLSDFGGFQIGRTIAMDLGLDYRKSFPIAEYTSMRVNTGLAVTNIGGKIHYIKNDMGFFSPSMFRFGALGSVKQQFPGEWYIIGDLGLQLSKPLSPSVNEGQSTIEGILSSFNDSPIDGGEWEETTKHIGLSGQIGIEELGYGMLRGGYSMNAENTGLYSVGATVNIRGFFLEWASLFPTKANPSLISPLSIGIGYRGVISE